MAAPTDTPHADAGARSMLTACIAVAGLGGLVFGYDLGVIVGALPGLVSEFHLSSTQEGLAVAGASLGQVIGALLGGNLTDRLGRKTMIRAQCFALGGGALAVASAGTFTHLLIGRIIMGFGFAWGVLSNVAWVSEIVPSASRGRAVSAYELTITIGLLMALLLNSTSISWRGLVLASIPMSVLQFLCFFVVPESPMWLLSKGRPAEAEAAIASIGGSASHLAECRAAVSHPVPSFSAAVREWRVPFIAITAIQALGLLTGGINIRIYALRIFHSVGVSESIAATLAIGLSVVKVLATLLSVLHLDIYGRRVFYMTGVTLLLVSCCLIAVGASPGGCAAGEGCVVGNATEEVDCRACPSLCGGCALPAQAVVVAGCFLGYIAYQISFGPVNFAVGSEMFPSEARARFLGVQTVVQGVFQMGTSFLFPVMRDAVGLPATMLSHTVFCILGLGFFAVRMVETKHRFPQVILQDLRELWSGDYTMMRPIDGNSQMASSFNSHARELDEVGSVGLPGGGGGGGGGGGVGPLRETPSGNSNSGALVVTLSQGSDSAAAQGAAGV